MSTHSPQSQPTNPGQSARVQLPVRRCPTLLVSSTASGQGKTTLTAALARHHVRQGRRVRIFKIGPDFLDPMVLSQVSGNDVAPLDLWMVGADECARLLFDAAGEADVILIEGAMGLFDGQPSAADLAERFGIDIAVVIDARGMGQTFGALALGLVSLRPELQVTGVVANRVAGDRHLEMLAEGLPDTVPLLAAVRRQDAASLPSRHLGLVQACEVVDLEQRIDAMADQLAGTGLTELPREAVFRQPPQRRDLGRPLAGLRVAVARDEAFSFLYRENLRVLEDLGAELVFFSPLADHGISADAVYLPGGYPELHLRRLSGNHAMHEALQAHVGAGRPLYAECGGMLYALDSLTDADGQRLPLAGLLPGHGRMQKRLAGLGMQALETTDGVLRGHSFHHSTMETSVHPVGHGARQHGSREGEPFYRVGPIRASYLHLYFPSNPLAAASLFLPD